MGVPESPPPQDSVPGATRLGTAAGVPVRNGRRRDAGVDRVTPLKGGSPRPVPCVRRRDERPTRTVTGGRRGSVRPARGPSRTDPRSQGAPPAPTPCGPHGHAWAGTGRCDWNRPGSTDAHCTGRGRGQGASRVSSRANEGNPQARSHRLTGPRSPPEDV